MRLLAKPAARITSGEIIFDGEELLNAVAKRPMREIRGNRHGDDLPGPDDLASTRCSRVERAADRGARDASQAQASRRDRTRRRAARAGRHPGAEAAPERLPAPVQRRDAPARDDRHGARLRPAAADRRRADHGAGRDHPGPDPGPHAHRGGARRARPSSSSPTTSASWPACATDDQRHVRRRHRRAAPTTDELFGRPRHPYTRRPARSRSRGSTHRDAASWCRSRASRRT